MTVDLPGVIAGTLQFPNADIRTNAANIVLDGPAAQILDLSNNDALADFAINAATGSFTIQNGRNFTSAGSFINAGTLEIEDSQGLGPKAKVNGATVANGATLELAIDNLPDSLTTNTWLDLPGASNYAGPLQTSLIFTDPLRTNRSAPSTSG